ncbi:muscle M-line assembly protein unc-89-like [Mytilus californianus]|uniref:muscle M-line assembly protein unc-89-like n=1 Tax=Mytilus californianus TaxID=6549 RepID=UPI0022475DF7|nr:muscle M-line assembly protein unc-89-like [Mytilus californianus]
MAEGNGRDLPENSEATWALAVWKEQGEEEEGTLPLSWIGEKHIMWPPGTNVKRLMKEMKKPSDNWMKFELVKIKFKSNKRKECEDYDFTTTAELSPDEADSDHGKKRILKKKVFQDFITEIGNEEGTKATDKSVGASKNGKNKDKGESQATVPRNQEKSSSMPKPPTKLIERNAQCKELVTEKKSSSQTSNHRDSRSPSKKLSSSQTSNHRESRSPSKKLKSTNTLKSTTRPSTRQESPPFRQKSISRSPLITQRSRS